MLDLAFMKKKEGGVVLTGMQPSGSVHIGNYFGSIDNLRKIGAEKNARQTFFMIADLHSLNTTPPADVLRQNILSSVAALYGCGVDAVVFSQATIKEHAELAIVLGAVASIGKLQRMTQFKTKAKIGDVINDSALNNVNLGLLSYPVLQAADILLYDADFVPVGADQKQHVELTRDIAQSFNFVYGCELFKAPEPIIDDESGKVMSLSDGRKKMSKSSDDVVGCLYLTDEIDVVAKKIKRAKTDSIMQIYYDPENRPEVSNLVKIFSLASGLSVDEVVSRYGTTGMAGFKQDLIQAITQKFGPIKLLIEEYNKDHEFLIKKLQEGMEAATGVARLKMDSVRDAVGLLRF